MGRGITPLPLLFGFAGQASSASGRLCMHACAGGQKFFPPAARWVGNRFEPAWYRSITAPAPLATHTAKKRQYPFWIRHDDVRIQLRGYPNTRRKSLFLQLIPLAIHASGQNFLAHATPRIQPPPGTLGYGRPAGWNRPPGTLRYGTRASTGLDGENRCFCPFQAREHAPFHRENAGGHFEVRPASGYGS